MALPCAQVLYQILPPQAHWNPVWTRARAEMETGHYLGLYSGVTKPEQTLLPGFGSKGDSGGGGEPPPLLNAASAKVLLAKRRPSTAPGPRGTMGPKRGDRPPLEPSFGRAVPNAPRLSSEEKLQAMRHQVGSLWVCGVSVWAVREGWYPRSHERQRACICVLRVCMDAACVSLRSFLRRALPPPILPPPPSPLVLPQDCDAPYAGRRVVVHGIRGRADMNGVPGDAVTFDELSGRCCGHAQKPCVVSALL